MVGKGSIEVCLLGEKGIRVEVNNQKKGSTSEAVAGNLISLKRLARAFLGFLGEMHSKMLCIPAFFIIYNSNPGLELNTLPYCSSITSFFFFSW